MTCTVNKGEVCIEKLPSVIQRLPRCCRCTSSVRGVRQGAHRAMHLLTFAGMQVGEFSRLNRQLILARKSSSPQGVDPNASDDTCLLRLVVLEGLVKEISTFEGPRSEGGLNSHAICQGEWPETLRSNPWRKPERQRVPTGQHVLSRYPRK